MRLYRRYKNEGPPHVTCFFKLSRAGALRQVNEGCVRSRRGASAKSPRNREPVPRTQGTKYLLAGDQAAALAPAAAEPDEEQHPGVAAPEEVRDAQVAAGTPQNGARQNDVRLAPEFGRDGLETLPVLAQQGGDVGETEVGLHLLRPLAHRRSVGHAVVSVPQEARELELLRVELGRLDVLDHLLHPVGNELGNVLLAGRTLQLELPHHEQSDPLLEDLVLEDATSILVRSAGLLDRLDQCDAQVSERPSVSDQQAFFSACHLAPPLPCGVLRTVHSAQCRAYHG